MVPIHASLSSTSVNVGVIVSVQCQPGTAFPDRRLTKFLQCVDNFTANAVTWNDTLADCQGHISLVIRHRPTASLSCVIAVTHSTDIFKVGGSIPHFSTKRRKVVTPLLGSKLRTPPVVHYIHTYIEALLKRWQNASNSH